ncbi:13858_t:CDS:2 [Acaulospora morrowiae]|uniref:13858_t:CDS:1 n=1 Tax=Acaulospora morrowiae TaxID=94023 RepID=A0A9N9FX22_9GLOM|nr:13858_t:CDS:2 [Acaulospora morrowiae]
MVEWTDSQIRILIDERRNTVEMKNIIILEGIESDFGIASQPELIENIIRALMDTNGIEEHEEVERVRKILISFVRIFGRGLKMNLIESILLIPQTVKHCQGIEEAEEIRLIIEEVVDDQHPHPVIQ